MSTKGLMLFSALVIISVDSTWSTITAQTWKFALVLKTKKKNVFRGFICGIKQHEFIAISM